MRAAMLFAAFVLAASGAPAASERPPSGEISPELSQVLREIKRAYWATGLGRRLLALTETIPVAEEPPSRGELVEYRGGGTPSFAVDRLKAEKATKLEFEEAFFLARQAALHDCPVELLDARWAAAQAYLDYSLQKAEKDAEFAGRLRAATHAAQRLVESRKEKARFAGERATDGRTLFPGRRPKRDIDRLGFDLYLFSEDPYLFYETVSQDEVGTESVTLTELSDFFARRGERLEAASFRAAGRSALLDGEVYPGRLARAALAVKDGEGLARLRERLGPFRTVGQSELARRVNRWIREGK